MAQWSHASALPVPRYMERLFPLVMIGFTAKEAGCSWVNNHHSFSFRLSESSETNVDQYQPLLTLFFTMVDHYEALLATTSFATIQSYHCLINCGLPYATNISGLNYSVL